MPRSRLQAIEFLNIHPLLAAGLGRGGQEFLRAAEIVIEKWQSSGRVNK